MRTVSDVFEEFSEAEKNFVYELVGYALEHGTFNREALVMFDDEQLAVVLLLLDQALK